MRLGPDSVRFVTDFADQAVILPVAAAVAASLAWQRRWRVAGGWIATVCAVLGAILALKLGFHACGPVWLGFPFDAALRSPSGHAASAAVTYGGILTLQMARTDRLPGLTTSAVAALLIAALFGATRMVLDLHSLPDVVAGGAVGVAGACLLPMAAGHGLRSRSGVPALGAAVLAAMLAHGLHLAAEPAIAMAGRLWTCGSDRPGQGGLEPYGERGAGPG